MHKFATTSYTKTLEDRIQSLEAVIAQKDELYLRATQRVENKLDKRLDGSWTGKSPAKRRPSGSSRHSTPQDTPRDNNTTRASKQTDRSTLSLLFEDVDTNNDGVVDLQEFLAAGGTKQEFEERDVNGDGTLDSRELSQIPKGMSMEEPETPTDSGAEGEGSELTRRSDQW